MPLEVTAPAEPVIEELPPVDPAVMAAIMAATKAAMAEAVAAAPSPTWRPGTVQGVSPADRTVTVLVDGDDTAITAASLIELPGLYQRVMVLFVPPSAVFVVGNQTAAGVPPGSLMAYGGTISNHQGATVGSATLGMPPPGWLWCAGQAVSRSTYAALFLAIGTTHGSGDGATTFNVPDYRGRVFLGLDNMGGSDAGRIAASNTLGGSGGITTVIAHTHTMGNHTHGTGTYAVSSHSHTVNSHNHDMGNHTHTIDPPTNGTLYGGPFDPGSGGTGNTINNTGSTTTSGPSTNNTSSASPGTDSQSPGLSGSSGTPSTNTTDSSGTGTEQLPPYLLCHVIIKA
jgi:microcystin-dependent protein